MENEKAMSDMIRKMNGYDGIVLGNGEKHKEAVPIELSDKIKRIIENELDLCLWNEAEMDIDWIGKLIDLYERTAKVFGKKESFVDAIKKPVVPTPWQPYNPCKPIDRVIYGIPNVTCEDK